MVSWTGLLLAVVTSSASAPLAVIISPQGRVLHAGAEARVGAVVTAGASLETRDSGWLELRTLADARIRISADTRASFEPDDPSRGACRFELLIGRAWVETAGAPQALAIGGLRVIIAPKTSVVIDRSSGGAAVLVVRRGQIDREDGAMLVDEGRLAQVRPDGTWSIASGGQALAELVVREGRQRVGDRAGVRAFLLDWVRVQRLGVSAPRASVGDLSSDREVWIARDQHLHLLEESLRPAPFFELEVPAKGPNVEIRVNYAD